MHAERIELLSTLYHYAGEAATSLDLQDSCRLSV